MNVERVFLFILLFALPFPALQGSCHAQPATPELDDLFEGEAPQERSVRFKDCDCTHETFHFKNLDDETLLPKWLTNRAREALVKSLHEARQKGPDTVLFCRNTGATVSCVSPKGIYRFIVCPQQWKEFQPTPISPDTLLELGIPMEPIEKFHRSVTDAKDDFGWLPDGPYDVILRSLTPRRNRLPAAQE